MITRKDNLLKRPWQQRKFENHRQKVLSALPAIDTGPPAYRSHVAVKLKKQQKEQERCKKIEHDNFLLLQKMNYITRTSRVDNNWKIPQPNFLNRVAVYNTIVPQLEDIIFEDSLFEDRTSSRKSRCIACTPHKPESPKIPEERIPWEPLKKPIGRVRSKSVPVRKAEPLPVIKDEPSIPMSTSSSAKKTERAKTSIPKTNLQKLSAKQPQRIVLSRGCLKLSLNFPSDTFVKYQERNVDKYLMRGICYCKNAPSDFYK